MTQVSWRRILERADGGSSAVDPHEHASDQRKRRRAGDYADGTLVLEDELKHAMRHTGEDDRRRHAAERPPQWEPIYDADEISTTRVPPQRNPLLDREDPPKPSGGGRNLLAITISLAVIGFAVHQIRTQWQAEQSETVSVPERPNSDAAAILAGRDESGAGAQQAIDENRSDPPESGRIDLRPSLADGNKGRAQNQAGVEQQQREAAAPAAQQNSGQSKDQARLNQDIEQATRLFSYRESSEVGETKTSLRSTPIEEGAAGLTSKTEKAMLDRGYGLIESGHAAGARLIFESLAEQNSALGAFALAQTYDAEFIQKRAITDVEPDEALAAKWYEHAGNLTLGRLSSR